MKPLLIIALLVTLAACSPSAATTQPVPTQDQAVIPSPTFQPTVEPTSTGVNIFATLTALAMLPTKTPEPSATSAPLSCTASNGSLSAMSDDNTISIIFTVTDCKITSVFLQGNVNGQWMVVSNEASEPITGSQFDFLYSFSDQDRYNLSGTFTSPTSADIQLVIYKGFRTTVDQPSPFTQDMIINGTANP